MDSAAQEPTEEEVWKEPHSYSPASVERGWNLTLHTQPCTTKWGRKYKNRKGVYCYLSYEYETLFISYSVSDAFKSLANASTDLKVLTVCAITGLAPVSILADKLEEEYPDLKDAADHLREWERLAREAANSSYL